MVLSALSVSLDVVGELVNAVYAPLQQVGQAFGQATMNGGFDPGAFLHVMGF